jgi:hypothetical protein
MTNQLIVQNCKAHSDTVTQFEVTTHSGVVILIWPHMGTVRIIDTFATGLCFLGKTNVTMQPSIDVEGFTQFLFALYTNWI